MKYSTLVALGFAVGLTNLAQAQVAPAPSTTKPAPATAPNAATVAPRGKSANDIITEHFRAGDKNHDGKITRAEADSGMPVVAKNYDQIDTAKTNALTLPQVLSYFEAKRHARAAEKAKRQQAKKAALAKPAGSTGPSSAPQKALATPAPTATPGGAH